jgi:hypothetical protein
MGCRGAASEGRCIPGSRSHGCRRRRIVFRNGVLIDATPGAQRVFNPPGLTRRITCHPCGSLRRTHFFLRFPVDPFRTSRCTSLMRLPSDMGGGPPPGAAFTWVMARSLPITNHQSRLLDPPPRTLQFKLFTLTGAEA